MIVEWLKAELAQRGLMHKELGEALGWDQSTTSKIMAGTRRITAEELVRVMEWLGYPNPLDAGGDDADARKILAYAANLDESQRRALILYLEALLG